MVRGFKLADSRAGWREFKYKTISVYAGGPAPTKLHYPLEEAYHGTHPGCKFFPEKDAGGVPIGAIVHVLAVCKNIRSIGSVLSFGFGVLT